MKIYTNRYRDFTPAQGIPVRITYGSPKWRLPYTLAASAKTVTPGRWFMDGQYQLQYKSDWHEEIGLRNILGQFLAKENRRK